MPGNLLNSSDKPYLKIIGGNFVQRAEENAEGANLRKWETPDGKKGETWEYTYKNWIGRVAGISFKKEKYGERCFVELDDAIIILTTSSRFFSDFACKIFNADLTKDIIFHPYDFESQDDGKKRKGISMEQLGGKLQNHFYDGKENLHGFPEVDEARTEKPNYWKMYFMEVTEFLTDKVKELEIPEIEKKEEPAKEDSELTQPPSPDEKVADDLPFDKKDDLVPEEPPNFD